MHPTKRSQVNGGTQNLTPEETTMFRKEMTDETPNTSKRRYWSYSPEYLAWTCNPYCSIPDVVTLEVIKWHTRQFSLEEVGNGLDSTEQTENNETNWYLCGNTVYRHQSKPEPVCDVRGHGAYYAGTKESHEPVNEMTYRCVNHGCTHPRECVDGTTLDAPLAAKGAEEMRLEEEACKHEDEHEDRYFQ